MYGKNPIRRPDFGDGAQLDVKSIFPTLQGEGPYVGRESVFVRLGGCNLACHFCDTEFEEFTAMAITDIATRVRELAADGRTLVVITGGEPLRQNIAPLCELLIAGGFTIQLETNGTLFRPLPEAVEIVCSPKNTGNGYAPVRDDLLARTQALKFIVSRHDVRYDHIADVGQGRHAIPIYVQPMDEYDSKRNADNLAFAQELAARHGYHLSQQMHKIWGIE